MAKAGWLVSMGSVAVMLLTMVLPSGGLPTTWYVATNGLDSNFGTGWADAWPAISNAVTAAADGDTILVSNGTYTVTNQIVIDRGITIRGVNGAANTVVARTGSGQTRLFYLSHAGAVLDGLTVSNGYLSGSVGGDAVYIATNGSIVNCIFVSNTVSSTSYYMDGGAVYLLSGGLVSNCLFRGNRHSGGQGYGGAVMMSGGGLVTHSTFIGNSSGNDGGALYMTGTGTVRNCLFYGNTAGGGGGAVFFHYLGLAESCTIVSNRAYTGGGVSQYQYGALRNCIVYHNEATLASPNVHDTSPSWAIATSNSCTAPLRAGPGNTGDDPQLVSLAATNVHLLPGSPCLNTGTNVDWMSAAADLDGNPRIVGWTNDMGALEYVTGPLLCGFVASPRAGMAPLEVVFTAYADGTNTAGLVYQWDFNNDGTNDLAGSDKLVVTNTYGPGTYAVSLTVANGSGESATCTKSAWIQSAPAVVYVATNGAHTFPYTNWSIASTSLQVAVDAGIDGTLVRVTNGTYDIYSQISVSKSVTVESVGGPAVTFVRRGGAGLHRIFKLTHPGALVSGFTVTNGSITGGGEYGGGVYLSAGTVSNCVMAGNVANSSALGGGAGCNSGGTLLQCVFTGNGGNCNGGGVYFESGGTARNCLFHGNSVSGQGGGFFTHFGGLIENCTVTSNSAASGGGLGNYGGSTVRNTIIYGNTASPADQNIYTANNPVTFTYTCTDPLQSGTGNIAADPEFTGSATNNFRLMPSSPCINAGTNLAWMTGATDLGGNPRLLDGTNDMGAYEYSAGPLQCGFIGTPLAGMSPLQTVFTASVRGTNTTGLYYRWDVNADSVVDVEGPGRRVVTNTYAAGLHSVALFVTNAAGESTSLVRSNYVQAAPAVAYVAEGGAHQFPFTNWTVAATTIQAAVDAGVDGTLVWVTNGTYQLTNQVTIGKGITVKGLNGPQVTVVKRAGPGNHRIFMLSHASAVVEGLTITNGYTTGDAHGAGVYMTAGTLRNCIVAGNSSYGGSVLGGGIYAPIGLVERCIISGNYCQGAGGGIDIEGGGRVRGCLIAGNTAGNGGGIFYRWFGIESCTIVSNRATGGFGGGGYSWQVGNAMANSIVYFNSPSNISYGGGSDGTCLFTCSTPLQGGVSNTAADPKFANAAAGVYRLILGSPCLNTGSNQAWMATATDLSGRVRILQQTVDMGAYESEAGMGTLFVVR